MTSPARTLRLLPPSPNASLAERRTRGRALRKRLSRIAQGVWKPAAHRPDPLELLARAERGHLPALLPIKHGRMAVSPFTFFRGAVPVMAADIARVPVTGLAVQICGDAHVRNLGAFAAPDGHLVFDINDFDETIRAPWEWDLKRLATSFVLAGREAGVRDRACLDAVGTLASSYRAGLRRFAQMPAIELMRYEVRRHTESGPVHVALHKAERVTLLCGSGCAGSHDELMQLAESLKSPIVHAMRGKEHVEWDNPYDVGMTGLIGFASGYHAMESCDALLMLGTDFPYRQFYPKQARIAQIDVRAEAIGRRAPVELGLIGQVGPTLRALLPRLTAKTDRRFLDGALRNYSDARRGLDELATGRPGGTLHPQHIARIASQLAGDDAIFTCDVGLPTVWAARYLAMNGRRRLIGSFWHGSMANAMAQAIGAQAASPGRQVISLSGDGGFTMLMGDLLSLSQLKLPVKVIVFNNGALGFIELEQKSSGFLDTGTELINPNFAAMAEAIGIKGVRIEDPADVEQKLAEALAHPGPVVIDAVVNRMELAMPPKVTAEMAKGFTLYMVQAVLNGRADEIVEIARSNLLR